MKSRKYLPTISELIDRLSIIQLKEVFIPDHKKEYAKEISDICHDIGIFITKISHYFKISLVKYIKNNLYPVFLICNFFEHGT